MHGLLFYYLGLLLWRLMEYGLGPLRLARSCEIGTESNSRSYMYVIYLHFGV